MVGIFCTVRNSVHIHCLMGRYIAVKLHPWIPVIYLVVLFEDWSRKLTLWTVEPDFEFSYGQVRFRLGYYSTN